MSLRPPKLALKTKFTTAVIGVAALVLLLVTAIGIWIEVATFRNKLVERVQAQAALAAFNEAAPLIFEDDATAALELAALGSDPGVRAAAVLNLKGGVFARYDSGGRSWDFSSAPRYDAHIFAGDVLILSRTIEKDGNPLGTLAVIYETGGIYEELERYVLAASFVFVIALAIAYLMGSVLQGIVLRPLHALVATAQAVSKNKDYSRRAPKLADDEIGSLVDNFNEMLGQIENREKELENTVLQRTMELKLTIAALGESEVRFRTISDSAPALIWIAEPSGDLNHVNRRWLEFTGRSLEAESGVGWQSGIHSDDRSAFLQSYESALQARRPFEVQFRLRRADGSYRWMVNSGIPRFDGRTFCGFLGSCMDITPQKESEHRLLEAKSRLERTRQALEEAEVGVILLTTEGSIRESDAVCERIFERPRDVIDYGGPFAWIHPSGREQMRSAYQRALTLGKVEIEIRGQPGWKPVLYIQAVLIKECDDTGAHSGMRCFIKDITDRILAEQRANEARLEFEAIFQAFPDQFYRVDSQGTILSCQTGSSGADSGEIVIGRRMQDLLPLSAGVELEKALKKIHKTGPAGTIEYSTTVQGREAVHEARLLATPERGQMLVIVRDITEQKTSERIRDEALEFSRLKSQFVANMSHEIRTPLNGILGILQLLQRMPMPQGHLDYISMARESGESLMTIVNDILDISKIEAGKLALAPMEFSLRKMVKDSLRAVAVRVYQKKLELICEIPPETPDLLIGDPNRIRQILLNLIGNAVKFTDHGEITLKVGPFVLDGEAINLGFAVLDTGVGIPLDKRARIFEAFFQADESNTRTYGGTGLGLKITRQLVAMMGGEISFEDNQPSGTIFELNLKLGIRSGTRRTLPRVSRGLSGSSVLCVATNRAALASTARSVEQLGMSALCASGSKEAILKIDQLGDSRALSFLIVDSDVLMADGFELMAALSVRETQRNVKVVVLTGAHQPGAEMILAELGASATLMKPVLLQDLYETFENLGSTRSESSPETGRDTGAAPAASSSLSVLLVEDIRVNQAVMEGMLDSLGHKVTIANNGKEALDLLGCLDGEAPCPTPPKFDLILMDIQMPVMDGIEAVSLIREREREGGAASSGSRIPIIALTACAMSGDRERYLACGMDGYVTKPVDLNELTNAICQAVSDAGGAGGSIAAPPEDPHLMALFARVDETEEALRSARRNAAMQDGTIFDMRELGARFSWDLEVMIEIITIFFTEHRDLIKRLESAVQNGQAEAIAFEAHAVKGCLGSISATSARRFAEELELDARNGKLEQAPEQLKQLIREINMVKTVLHRVLQSPEADALRADALRPAVPASA